MTWSLGSRPEPKPCRFSEKQRLAAGDLTCIRGVILTTVKLRAWAGPGSCHEGVRLDFAEGVATRSKNLREAFAKSPCQRHFTPAGE